MEGGSDSTPHSLDGIQLAAAASQVVDEHELQDVQISVDALDSEKWNREDCAGKMLDRIPEYRRIQVDFSGVNAQVTLMMPDKGRLQKYTRLLSRQVTLARGREVPKKQILSSMFGHALPGEVLGMMGPSGSGKTTLLSILGDRAPRNIEVSGSIRFNGQPLTKAVKRRIGYVTQDDLMYGSLTVFETLHFTALLRLSKSMTRAEKRQRVEAVISALGLEKCRDTLIGGPMIRGVSGGERKRASVGHEMMMDPAVVMLDEPTSGLDSTAALHLMKILRKLAEGGRSIITSIHQPSSRLYQELDNLMLLSEGEMMYYGDAKLAIGWFKTHGRPVPLGVNIADFILDLANGEISDSNKSGEECRQELVSLFLSYSGREGKGVKSEEDFRWADEQEGRALSIDKKQTDIADITVVNDSPAVGHGEEKWGAGYLEQLIILGIRTLRVQRFESLSTQNFMQFFGVGAISGLLWWQVGGKDTVLSVNDSSGLIFFLVIFVEFTAMFRSLFTFPSEFMMMKKERSSGMYKLSAFYFSRTLAEVPLDCFIPTLLVIIMYWMAGLRATFAAFVSHWLTILLLVLCAQTVGLLIGSVLMDVRTATAVCSVIMLTMMLTGGYYIRDVPDWLDWMKYLSLPYFGYNVAMKVEFNGRTFRDCGGLGSKTNGTCVGVDNIRDALSIDVDIEKSVLPEVLALFAWLIILRIVLYFVLKEKTKS